jgi:exonuclease VII small subunit
LDQHYTAADDPRRVELLGYQERIELDRLDRRLGRRARRPGQDGSLLPVERAYIEAVRLLEHDGPQGVDRLKSVIELYEQGSDASATTRRCLELAQRRLQQHRIEVAQIVEDDLAALDARLQLAERLSSTEPETARKMFQAVVDLYGDKPWAASAVARAQDALAAVAHSAAPHERR